MAQPKPEDRIERLNPIRAMRQLGQYLLRDYRLGYERVLVGLVWLGSVVAVAGCLAGIGSTFLTRFQPDRILIWSLWGTSIGLGLILVSVLMSWPVERLRRYKAEERSGSRYERRKNWTRLKSGSILLNLLLAFAVVELGIAFLTGFGAEPVTLPSTLSVERVTFAVVMFIAANVAYVHRIGLEIERPERASNLESLFFLLGLGGGLIFLSLGGYLGFGTRTFPLFGELVPGHGTLFLLAGLSAVTGSLYLARKLPTIRALYLEERDYQRGGYRSRQKSVVMPTMIAFAILFLVFFLLFLFELSIVGDFGELAQNVVVLGAFAFIVIALLVSLGVSFYLAGSEEDKSLYRQLRSEREQTELTVLAVSAGLGVLFLAATISIATGRGVFGIDTASHRWVDALALGVLGVLGPYGFYKRHHAKRIRDLEERFPDFLRDLAASRKAGLTLTNAVKIAAEGEYGALTPDIEKMADQLSWNVSFEEALDRFAERVNTPLVKRATTLINEASRTGGHVVDVLDAAAIDAREIKTLENERRLTMTLYTVVIYIAFFVFLGVAAVLYGQFIPTVIQSGESASQAGLQAGSGALSGLGASGVQLSDYRTFFFIGSITQGIGNGILAGIMESGDAMDGLRHAFGMVAVTFLIFAFFLI